MSVSLFCTFAARRCAMRVVRHREAHSFLTLSPCHLVTLSPCHVAPAAAMRISQSLGCHPFLTHRPSPPNLCKSAEPSGEGAGVGAGGCPGKGGGPGKGREESAVKKSALFARLSCDLRHGPAQHDNTKKENRPYPVQHPGGTESPDHGQRAPQTSSVVPIAPWTGEAERIARRLVGGRTRRAPPPANPSGPGTGPSFSHRSACISSLPFRHSTQ
jgi:hypothetical protein